MTEYGGPVTLRCQMCGINWPYANQFRRCSCGQPCKALKLPDETDEVLNWQEAVALHRDGEAPSQPKQAGRDPSPDELHALRRGLDFWPYADGPDDPLLRNR